MAGLKNSLKSPWLGTYSDVDARIERYAFAQDSLLRWIETNGQAAELFDNAANLLWLLLGRQRMVGWPDSHVASLLALPRNRILGAISGVNQPAAVRWLSRVELSVTNQATVALLIDALRAEVFRSRWAAEPNVPLHWIEAAVQHLAMHNTPAFSDFCLGNPSSSLQFLSTVREAGRFFNDALRVADAIGIDDAAVALGRCRDFSAIRRLHDRWMDRLNRHSAQLVTGETHFPAPPVEANGKIFPIETLEDLRAEGRLMHHCVAVYEGAVAQGESYIYRMIAPERATIELKLTGHTAQLCQVTLAYNERPSAVTIKAVERWLESQVAGRQNSNA